MQKQILIRKAESGDVTAIAGLMTELGYPTSSDEMEERLNNISREKDYRTIVAVYNGIVAGVACAVKSFFYEQNGSYVRLVALVTDPAARNKGIARALVAAVETWAKGTGAGALLVNCGKRKVRDPAHALYKSLGFVARATAYRKQL
jgi:GNAT superfamily N-acetyltransferase